MPPASSAARVAVGLSAVELDEPTASFFDRFDWEGTRLDLDVVTAEEFFGRF